MHSWISSIFWSNWADKFGSVGSDPPNFTVTAFTFKCNKITDNFSCLKTESILIRLARSLLFFTDCLFIIFSGEFIRDLVALESGGSGGVVWRIRANATKLVCAVGSRNGTEETKLLVLDFDVSDSNKWISVVRLIPPIFCCFAATVFLSTNSNEWHCEIFLNSFCW